MPKSVEYEILLKNGQFAKAAKESEKLIHDVGSAVADTGSEYDKLSPHGKQVADNLREIAEAQNSSSKSAESLRTQLRNVKKELEAMEMAGKSGAEEFRQLQEHAGKLQDVMSDVNAQTRIMAHDQRGIQGVISGITGLSGAMSAAAGVVGLFGEENENLQKIMLKVQSVMAITVGLQQLQATLDKDSAFRLVTLNGLKEWWAAVVAKSSSAEAGEVATLTANTVAQGANAVATTAAGAAATASAGAFKVLGVAIKSIPGIGWILAGISAVITAATLVVKKHKENAKEQKRLIDEEIRKREELRKEIADAAGDNVAKVSELAAKYKMLGDDMEQKKKFIRDNAEAFKSLGVEMNNVSQADNLLIKNTDKFIKAEILKAKAMALRAKAAELIKENLDILNGSRSPRKTDNEYLSRLPTVSIDYFKFDLENQLEQMFVEVAKYEQQAADLMRPFTSPLSTAVRKGDGGKSEEKAKSDLLVGYKANFHKLMSEYRAEAKGVRDQLGKVVVIDGAEITIDEDAVEQQLQMIGDKYQDALGELKKKYGLSSDTTTEEKEDAKNEIVDVVSIVDDLIGSLNGLGLVARDVVMKRMKELVKFLKESKGDMSLSTDDKASYFGISKETLDNLVQSGDAFDLIQQKLEAIDKSDAITNLVDAVKRLKAAKEEYQASGDLVDELSIAKAKDLLLDAIMQVKGALESSLKNLSNSIKDIADILDNDKLREVADGFDAVMENVAAAEAGAEAWGGWWGAIIGGLTDLLPRIVSWFTNEKKLNKEIKETNKELSILDSKIKTLKVGGVDESNIRQIDSLYDDYISEYEKLLEEYENNNNKGKYDAEIAALRLQIATLKQEREDLWTDMFSDTYGLSATDIFGELSDAIWNCFVNGEMSLENFDEKFNEIMLNIIKKKVLFNVLGDSIEAFVNELGDDLQNGGFDNGSQDAIDYYREQWNAMVSGGMEGLQYLNELFGNLGAFGTSATSLAGSIQNITSEQAGMLAGQTNAMRIEQMNQSELLADQLASLYAIERNTRYIRDIYNHMRSNGFVGGGASLNRAYGQN